MSVLATAIVDWSAMWKIFLVVLLAGTGTVIVFGFLLLGLKLKTDSGPTRRGRRIRRSTGWWLPAGRGVRCDRHCGVAVGVYAMSKKPSSKPAKPKAALVIPAGPQVKVIASLR